MQNTRSETTGQSVIREIEDRFIYKDGLLIDKKTGVKASKINGRYEVVSLNGKRWSVHRLVYLLHHGELPDMVDHKDGNPTNNKIENLRAATRAENGQNQKLNIKNTSGCKGVVWVKSHKKWRVDVAFFGKRKSFGYFEDLELADLVATEARDLYHGEFARHY